MCAVFIISFGVAGYADMKSDFTNPPLKYRPIGFNKVANATTLLTTNGMGGVSEMGTCSNYRTPAWYHSIHSALATIKQLGGYYTIYDENQFPSGSAGNGNANHGGICNPPAEPLLATLYPNNTIKRLDKTDNWVTGPTTFTATIQPNTATTTLMAIVAMDTADKPQRLLDLTDSVKGTTISWSVPLGRWDVMVFECVKDGNVICDYMDSVSVNLYIKLAYQPYYDSMPEYCGNTLRSSFYDEPSLIQGSGRPWTPLYNQKFIEKYGFNPRPYYPALWYNIGPQTQAARNYLFGMRTDIYSRGFMKQINDWDSTHGIMASGHQDNEDWTCPVGSSGDVIKCWKYQAIPTVDDIGYTYTHLFYKFFSSAAYNWDKTLVAIENGGDYGKAIEQLADGIQRQHCFSVPALTYNEWFGRCGVLLQPPARHVADIAMLYPIATCQGTYYFGSSSGPSRDTPVPEADYDTVGNILSSEINRDFTWIHPEVLDSKCTISGPVLKLNNTLNHEEYKVFIMPGQVTINWSNVQKIKQFYDNGGQVIATGTLPSKSAEFGHDTDVVSAVKAMFPITGQTLKNANGGSAVFLGTATKTNMLAALDNALAVYDVEFEPETGGLRYIHKVLNDSMNIYFFGNNSAASISTYARLRGNFTPQQWDPHTGLITTPQFTQVTEGGTTITRVPITLTTLHSVFITGAYATSTMPARYAGLAQKAQLTVSKSLKNLVVLTYCVPQSSQDFISVTMHAFNVKGSRVALLLDNRLKAGSYTANWSTRAMPAGTYIVRLKIDGHGEVIRKVAVE
jgi:hypothetical protein